MALGSSKKPQQASADRQQMLLWKTQALPESFEEIADQAVEIRVGLSEIFDLPNRMNHRRMMLSAETAADLGQRRVRQRLAQIHGDLPRHRNRLRIVPRLQLDELQVVIIGDELL